MTVRVIGFKYDQVEKVDCDNCGAVLEYTRVDITVYRYTAMIDCPNCKQEVEVPNGR
jgi:Zn ribbon nucleic-acid-binding protein